MIEFVSFSKHQFDVVAKRCDLVFDASSLPTPNRALRVHNGLDKGLQQEMMQNARVQLFYKQCVADIMQCADRNDRMITIGVYCRAGKHRSVAIVERLANDNIFAAFDVSKSHQSLFN